MSNFWFKKWSRSFKKFTTGRLRENLKENLAEEQRGPVLSGRLRED